MAHGPLIMFITALITRIWFGKAKTQIGKHPNNDFTEILSDQWQHLAPILANVAHAAAIFDQTRSILYLYNRLQCSDSFGAMAICSRQEIFEPLRVNHSQVRRHIQSTLVISTLLISKNRLSRSENLVPV